MPGAPPPVYTHAPPTRTQHENTRTPRIRADGAEGERAVERGRGGGSGREGGGWAKYCTCQQFGTKSYN